MQSRCGRKRTNGVRNLSVTIQGASFEGIQRLRACSRCPLFNSKMHRAPCTCTNITQRGRRTWLTRARVARRPLAAPQRGLSSKSRNSGRRQRTTLASLITPRQISCLQRSGCARCLFTTHQYCKSTLHCDVKSMLNLPQPSSGPVT